MNKVIINLDNYNDIIKLFENKTLDVTIGAFDGIHLGHLEICNHLLKYSDNEKTVITFSIHPDICLNKRKEIDVINTNKEKISIFKKLGFDNIIFLDNDILKMSYLEFEKFLKDINVQNVFIGNDFRYGKNGIGNKETLMKAFNTFVIDDIYYDDLKVSSTLIRSYLESGKIEDANKLLYSDFSIFGKVVKGNKIGTLIGFKTANVNNNKFPMLKKGVYSVNVIINKKTYKGICNFGDNPTINTYIKPRIEVHVLDFDEDIYNKNINVIFKKFIREEIKFSSLDQLKEQIKIDLKSI